MSDKRVRWLMVLTSLLWSGAFITGKFSVQQFPPFSLTFFRFLFTLPFIFIILYVKEPQNLFPSAKQWPPLILLGFVGTFCSEDTPKKKSLKNVWDYLAAVAFIVAGIYYFSTQRASQGAFYILVGLFFFFITRYREKKKQ